MLFEVLMNIVVFILKFALRFVLGLLLVPFGVFMGLVKFFPDFHQGTWWTIVWAVITIVAYYILWKPILWITGLSVILGAGNGD